MIIYRMNVFLKVNLAMKPGVCIYILTHNRTDTILECVNSALNQTYKDYIVYVSDNSDNDETELLLSNIVKYNHKLVYHHNSNNSSNAHFNSVLKNNEYEYFMLFHDDDQMMPNMLETLMKEMENSPHIAAVGSNAIIKLNGKITSKRFLRKRHNLYCDAVGMIKSYAYNYCGCFPSYMYRMNMVQKLFFDTSKGGKYADASFLVSVASIAPVCIIATPLMYYNRHKSQDVQKYEFVQFLSLIDFFKTLTCDKKLIRDLRLKNVYVNVLRDGARKNNGHVPFRKMVFKLFVRYSLFNYFWKYAVKCLCQL